jgi:hypothetical protein
VGNETGKEKEPFKKGQRLLASDLNWLAAQIGGRIVGADGITVRAVGGNLVIGGRPERGNLTDWEERYKVIAINDDTLTARKLENCSETGAGLNFLEGAPEITIWKPWELQRQAYASLTVDGVTYTYTSSQKRSGVLSGNTETEIIIPRYYVGCVVYASRVRGGAAPNGPTTRLMDKNNAGRAWAKEFE